MERWTRLVAPALMLLPGAAAVYLAFNAGGFFPGTPAFAALILIQVLILRVLLAEDPFGGASRWTVAAVALIAAYAAWTLASALWSEAVWRPLVEFDRALLYLAGVVVLGSLGVSEGRLRMLIWGLAAGLAAVSLCALITRVLPDVWPIEPNVANDRLSYPVGYWNGLGLMAGLGAILCVHLTCRARGPALPRVLAAAAVPMLATTLYFTFSRGAILATVVGLALYVVVARPRGLVSGLAAVAPLTAIALAVAYGSDHLATPNPTGSEAVDEGKGVALAVGICMVVAAGVRLAGLLLDRRLAAPRHLIPPRPFRIGSGVATVGALVVFAAVGGFGWIGDQYDRFAEGTGETSTVDLRERLTDPGNNGRIDHWEVAFDSFGSERLHGTGAGSWQIEWEQDRDVTTAVIDAHGLYFEVASELGLVGLLLLVAFVLVLVVGLAVRSRGARRTEYAALLAIGVAWALHAGIDWDWELPAVTLPVLAACAAGLGRPASALRTSSERRENAWRMPVAVALVLVVAAPVLISISQGRLNSAAQSFGEGDCAAALPDALSAAEVLAARPEPYEIVGYCQVERGFGNEAIEAMEKAVERDPLQWEYRYGLAVAHAAAGRDARPEARRALERNPREPIVRDLVRKLDASPRDEWPSVADEARVAMYESGLLSLP